jgi:vacuolar-type H+-ATPase subunit F/Vma7
MGCLVVIGESFRVEGFRLAGAFVLPAEDDEAARRAWEGLEPDVAVAVLTPRAAEAIGPRRAGPLTVVMPPLGEVPPL